MSLDAVGEKGKRSKGLHGQRKTVRKRASRGALIWPFGALALWLFQRAPTRGQVMKLLLVCTPGGNT